MVFEELTPVAGFDLPLNAFRDHLRLGRGFADEGVQDAVLEAFLRAAVVTIEGRTGQALYRRAFGLKIAKWREPDRQPLPVAPVAAITQVRFIPSSGSATTVDRALYRLEPDSHRPTLCATGTALPLPPTDTMIEITLLAGYSYTWDAIPADLAQAVLLLAAHFHEHRAETAPATAGAVPFGVAALIERYRTVRILGATP